MMSKWFEVLNVNFIREGANADLQAYYGVMSVDQGTVEGSWGKRTRECSYTSVFVFYYCSGGCGDRDRDCLASLRIPSSLTKHLFFNYAYICLCWYIHVRAGTLEARGDWYPGARVTGSRELPVWLQRNESMSFARAVHIPNSWTISLPLRTSSCYSVEFCWLGLLVSTPPPHPPLLIAFSSVQHYVKK